jgi:ATPase subunit of ABC transporter with duplicated ATPase domains
MRRRNGNYEDFMVQQLIDLENSEENRQKFIKKRGGLMKTMDWFENKIQYVQKKIEYHTSKGNISKIKFNQERLEKLRKLMAVVFPD